MPTLEARGVVKCFGHENRQTKTPGGIDLNVREGEIVSMIGPSGCGKFTFLRIVAGQERPDGGQISFGGKPVTGTGPDRIMFFRPRSSDDSDLLQMQQEIRSELWEKV